ncbi:MAG: hypothetical protein IJY38_01700 [Clostridia bacterium]|nr:hypothetical protein [Clostridia bacterium]
MKKSIKRGAVILSAVLVGSVGFSACGGEPEYMEASYYLVSATNQGLDITDYFQSYSMNFKDDGTVRTVISYLGLLETRDSQYTIDGDTITETYAEKSFTYTINGTTLETTIMDEFDGAIDVVLQKEMNDGYEPEVDFEGVLFGRDISDCKYYNYCPAIITEKDEAGNDIMHVWFCTNRDDGLIMDYIGYRKGVKQPSGKWRFSDLQIVMEPTPNTWDARHTCDPAVIKGEFKLGGETYPYLMAYLGCITEDYSNNETGIAVAKSPTGPWIKVDHLNPIVPWAQDCQSGTWGTGMPALVSIDKKGEVLMFHQSSARGVGVQRWDFSDLDAPNLKAQWTSSMNRSVLNSAGTRCNFGIPDFAFDPVKKRFYVFGVTNERNPADVTKTHVNSHSVLAYIDGVDSMEEVAEKMRTGNYTWTTVGHVGPNETGWERNHNPGIVRDVYGYIPDSSKIGVIVSTGKNDWAYENIFTYRLYGQYFDID